MAEPESPVGDHWSFTRSDLALLRRAARENWGVPDRFKTEALYQVAKILASDDPDLEPRVKLAAIRLLAMFDRGDLAAAKLELERSRLEPPPAATDLRSALELAEQAIRERDGHGH